MARNCPSKVIVNVAVIILLSFEPAIGTLPVPFLDYVREEPGTNLVGVWSRFNINESGTLYFSTLWAISWKNDSSISSLTLFGISTFPVVAALLLKPILLNRLCVQNESCMLIQPRSISGWRSIRPSATAIATAFVTTPPSARTA